MLDIILSMIRAFLVGGALCTVAQVLIDKTMLTPARILVLYVVSGVLLGASGVYKYLTDIGGAGATVPLTGFGNLIATGMKKAIDEKGYMGIFTGALSAASGGTCAALVFSFIAALFVRSKRRG